MRARAKAVYRGLITIAFNGLLFGGVPFIIALCCAFCLGILNAAKSFELSPDDIALIAMGAMSVSVLLLLWINRKSRKFRAMEEKLVERLLKESD